MLMTTPHSAMNPQVNKNLMPTVADAAASIRCGELTPVELVQRCLDSIKTHNPTLHAFGDVYAEEALRYAETLTREAKENRTRGGLHGVPFAIKDLFATAGLRTTRGSLTAMNWVPQEDAPVIRRLNEAGAILLGKAATTEFGWSGASYSRVFGNGCNPWDARLTSGGSSSGSAISVAARMVPASLGSDGGGSVRIPSAFCGVFAMKGSHGRIPTWPWSATEMLSHAGPITRTVRDSALLFDVLAGPDSRDHQALPAATGSYLARCEEPLKRVRVAFCPTLFGVDVDPEISRVVGAAVERIARALPIDLEMPVLGWHDPLPTFETLWVAGRGIVYGQTLKNCADQLDPGFARLIGRASDYSLEDYLTAIQRRATFACQVHALFDTYDFLLTPTLPILPFDADLIAPPELDTHDSALPWACWTPFTYPFNLSGNPAASLPCGWSDTGLPVGLQVVGPRFADADVLQFCSAIEAIMPWAHRLPPMLGV
ncbi:MAG: amidase family protein [Paraburkholderia sp.]